MTDFADRILAWYDLHGRTDLPWQQKDAYAVWVSEIMLQQTQVQTVIPYFERFMQRFPTVKSLADSSIDEVLQRWSGLGYYARARNLHKAAGVIRDEYGGEFPDDFEAAVALPGIGRSTAGAILSLAYGQRHAILDGNVKRVLARHEAIGGWPGKTAVANRLWALAEEHTPQERVADYTQAIMDLGATLCVRSNPACGACPVASDCKGLAAGTVSELPGRKPKTDKPLKQTTMVLAVHEGALFLERRPPSGIWGGLWSLPEIGDRDVVDWCRHTFRGVENQSERWAPLRHSFSHYDLDIHPVVVRIRESSRKVADGDGTAWHPLDGEPPGGIAAPVQKLIDQLRKTLHVTNS